MRPFCVSGRFAVAEAVKKTDIHPMAGRTR
jgi:hypothetical protein